MPDLTDEEKPEDDDGSLGDMLGALAQALKDAKHDTLFSPEEQVFTMEFPVEVKEIKMNPIHRGRGRLAVGALVSIRPCAEKHNDKTFIGISLGDLPVGQIALHRPSTDVLTFHLNYNPAFFVPEIQEIVFGQESWWDELKGPEALKQIEDSDIENTWYVKWYVKLFKQMAEAESKGEESSKDGDDPT